MPAHDSLLWGDVGGEASTGTVEKAGGSAMPTAMTKPATDAQCARVMLAVLRSPVPLASDPELRASGSAATVDYSPPAGLNCVSYRAPAIELVKTKPPSVVAAKL